MSTRGRQGVYQRETGCLLEGHRVSTRGRQGVYQREIRCLPEGDRVSTRGSQGVYQREIEGVYKRETGCLNRATESVYQRETGRIPESIDLQSQSNVYSLDVRIHHRIWDAQKHPPLKHDSLKKRFIANYMIHVTIQQRIKIV